MPKKIFTQELEGTRRRGRPRKGWKEEVERDLQVLGVRRWRELVADGKNGRTLFDRPKPTVGCSANGRRRRINEVLTQEESGAMLIFVFPVTHFYKVRYFFFLRFQSSWALRNKA